ncbi:MAG: DUF2806 domain-containing protein [Hominimerdicola sp.]
MGATEIVTALVSPVEKLMDTVSEAIGKAYEPHHLKKMADAKAYEIETLGNALRNNCDMPIVYNADGSVQVDTSNYEELVKRAGLRLAFQEVKKQENIEAVIDNAYNILEEETEVSNAPVDSGWMLRFMNSVEDVDDDELQILWGKILAGEIKSPDTYSLRTLEVLKNISKKEAELFCKIAKFITDDFLLNDTNFISKFDISYTDILKLDDCGLMNSDGLINRTIPLADKKVVLQNDDYILIHNSSNINSDNDTIQLNVFLLTEAGKNILKVLNVHSDNEYFLELCRHIKSQYSNYVLSIHKTNKKENGRISYLIAEII